TPVAFAVALLWSVHPLNTEAVDYLTQRTESLMAMLLMATLYASIRAQDDRGRGWWTAIAIVACALGMACKETMAVAPIIVVLHDRLFGRDGAASEVRHRWPLYAGLASTWIVLAYLNIGGPRSHTVGLTIGVSPWTYALNQTVMIVRYVRLAVW